MYCTTAGRARLSGSRSFWPVVVATTPWTARRARVERNAKVDFLTKWVRPDKEDGRYLPDVSGQRAVWNWRPEM